MEGSNFEMPMSPVAMQMPSGVVGFLREQTEKNKTTDSTTHTQPACTSPPVEISETNGHAPAQKSEMKIIRRSVMEHQGRQGRFNFLRTQEETDIVWK
jgi:hypothetical protein